jgi:serine/threonine protein kinase
MTVAHKRLASAAPRESGRYRHADIGQILLEVYPAEGEVLEGKYRIEKKLGEGGMGAVFRARHLLRKAQVALKFMSPAMTQIPEAVSRFMNEAVSASEISSDHVVKIFDVCRWGDTPYLVMEYLEGQDLSQEIALAAHTRQPIGVPRAVHLVLQILRALQVAHGKGITHRDLKPANAFLIHHEGEPDFVKLLDFGISKKSEEEGGVSLTKTNTAMGTPLYMAPEQAKSAKDADARSDLYSVAALLYETLAGRPPLEAETYSMILFKLFQEEPAPLRTHRPDVPPELEHVIHHGLAKDPARRFQTSAEFAAALAPFADPRSQPLLARILAASRTGQQAAVATPASLPLPPTRVSTGTIGDSSPGTDATLVAVPTAIAFAPAASSPGMTGSKPARSKAPLFAVGAIAVAAGIGAAVLLARRSPDPKPSGASETEEPASKSTKIEAKSAKTPSKGDDDKEPAKPSASPAPPPSSDPSAKPTTSQLAVVNSPVPPPPKPTTGVALKPSAPPPPPPTATTTTAAPTTTATKKKLDWDLTQ